MDTDQLLDTYLSLPAPLKILVANEIRKASGRLITGNWLENVPGNPDSWFESGPKFLKMPIVGFRNPQYHVLMLTDSFFESLMHNINILSYSSRNSAKFLVRRLGKFATYFSDEEWLGYARSMYRFSEIINSYFSLHFYGVQSIST